MLKWPLRSFGQAMKPATAPSAVKIQTVLGERFTVLEIEAGTRTAADAAAAIGCAVAEIAKSMTLPHRDERSPSARRRLGRQARRRKESGCCDSARKLAVPTPISCAKRQALQSAAYRPLVTRGRRSC
jgi:hypothetical protein